jgi:hypothetical protein
MTLVKNYSMIDLKSVAMVLLMAFAFASCKKNGNDTVMPPVSPMVGKWVGMLTTNGAPAGSLYIVIKQSGILEAQNTAGQKIADGTWELGGSAGTTFNCSYITNSATPQKYNLIGNLDAPTKMTGAYGTGSSKVNGGFWNMSKK